MDSEVWICGRNEEPYEKIEVNEFLYSQFGSSREGGKVQKGLAVEHGAVQYVPLGT